VGSNPTLSASFSRKVNVASMFNPVSSFSKQFVPFEEGYLYNPSRKSGGKFVSSEEYEQLVAEWEAIAGRKGIWKTTLAMVGCVFLVVTLQSIFGGSEWLIDVSTWVAVIAVLARFFWFSMAPRRLVSGRPDAAPPRSPAASKRAARSLVSWGIIIWAFIVSTAIFGVSLAAYPKSLSVWLWVAGSGAMSAGYLWVAIMKYRDGPDQT
jgi:hypothetical protein